MSGTEPKPLSPDIEALLELERRRPDLSATDSEQIASRVDSTLDWLVVAGSLGAGAAAGGLGARLLKAAWRGASAHWKVGLATFVAGGLAGGLVRGALEVEAPPAPALPVVEKSAPLPPPPPGPKPEVVAPAARPRPPAPVAVKPPAPAKEEEVPAPDAQGRDVDLARERGLLEMARTSLGRGKSGDALEALAAHGQQFPEGVLAEERESLWIRLLLEAGDFEQARDRARQLHARFPRSMLWPALAAALWPDGGSP
ncbi:MAG: hypothetical protein ACYC8T_21705 [Myxococcaceae bacterium]